MVISRHYLVSGRVQGVGFRQFTLAAAQQEGLQGFVQNFQDGRVRAVAIGEESSIARFESCLRRGPSDARVDGVEVNDHSGGRSYKQFFILESNKMTSGFKAEKFKELIREVPGFPKEGILFYDITTLLLNGEAFRASVDAMADDYREIGIDLIAGIESRGFIFGAAIADRLGVGFVPIRKPGKLPSTTVAASYSLEYGSDSLEVHEDAIQQGQKVLIVDDLLATGGTAEASVRLIKECGGEVVGLSFLIELNFLNGRSKLSGTPLSAVFKY